MELPLDLYIMFAQYLDCPRDLLSLSATCSDFRYVFWTSRVAHQIWGHLYRQNVSEYVNLESQSFPLSYRYIHSEYIRRLERTLGDRTELLDQVLIAGYEKIFFKYSVGEPFSLHRSQYRLYQVCYFGHRHLIQPLLERGAEDIDSAYVSAAAGGHVEIVEHLRNRGAICHEHAMAAAALRGHYKIVEQLIQYGAGNYNLAMRDAARGGHRAIIDLLILSGANDFNGVLHVAAEAGYDHIVDYMIQLGATDFVEAAKLAAKNGHHVVVDRFLNLGIDPDLLMESAALGKQTLLVDRLIAIGAKNYNVTLLAAAEIGNLSLVRQMIERGATRIQDAIRIAIRRDHGHIVRYLTPLV